MSGIFEGGGGPEEEQFRREYEEGKREFKEKRKSRAVWTAGCLGAVGLVLLIFGGSSCATYNSLQTKREKVRVASSDIDVQLQRRADLIPNLVNTVKGYTKHEEQVFSDIANARSRLLNAQTIPDKAAANDQVSNAIGRLLVLAENYPDLKANEQFRNLQYELAGTENRIQVARRDYNQAVLDYNTSIQRFPAVVLARLFGFQRAEEFKAAESAKEVPKVSF